MSALTAFELREMSTMLKAFFEKEYMEKIYPVGSIYLSTNDTDPTALFGGTWERIKDTFLLAAGDTYAAGTTGGEAKHTLTLNEMPIHYHYAFGSHGGDVGDNKDNFVRTWTVEGTSYPYAMRTTTAVADYGQTSTNGADQPHNNMPPYLTVYAWKRIA